MFSSIAQATDAMMFSIAANKVPAAWERVAYPSLLPLGAWVANLSERAKQLQEWCTDFQIPRVTWLSGLFVPQSFLTAVTQSIAQRNDWPLEHTHIHTEVTKKAHDEIGASARDGAYVHGLWIEGARWDERMGCLDDQRPRELHCRMPVLLLKAVNTHGQNSPSTESYSCPVYRTRQRGDTFVFSVDLRTKASPSKWILTGTAMILDAP
jgi:dynein heavy chain